jgi:hypothetical protein
MKISLSILFLALPFCVQAADLYRWVDEDGKTHFSDIVPEKYKKSAKRYDSGQYKVNEADRKAAQERARQVAEHPVNKTAPQETAQDKQSISMDAPAKQQKKPVNPNDCNALRQQYAESQACFSTFRNANGSVRGEAFERCVDVPDPSIKCGATSN